MYCSLRTMQARFKPACSSDPGCTEDKALSCYQVSLLERPRYPPAIRLCHHDLNLSVVPVLVIIHKRINWGSTREGTAAGMLASRLIDQEKVWITCAHLLTTAAWQLADLGDLEVTSIKTNATI